MLRRALLRSLRSVAVRPAASFTAGSSVAARRPAPLAQRLRVDAVRGLHASAVHQQSGKGGVEQGGEEDENQGYVPPYPAVVFEAAGVVFRSGQEATFRVNGDVRDAVQCLKFDGVKTALLCTPAEPLTADALKDLEIGKHFNALFTPSQATSLPALCDILKVTPKECVYVGQTEEGLKEAAALGMRVIKGEGDQSVIVREMEEACETSLVNFAWTRDIYAGVLWKNNKDCVRQDAV